MKMQTKPTMITIGMIIIAGLFVWTYYLEYAETHDLYRENRIVITHTSEIINQSTGYCDEWRRDNNLTIYESYCTDTISLHSITWDVEKVN